MDKAKAYFKKSVKRISEMKVLIVALLVLSVFYVNSFVIVLVHGDSMKPTFLSEDIVLLKKENEIEHNDIVIFEPPKSWMGKGQYVKRVVGLPGDKIQVKDRHLYVNGEQSVSVLMDNTGEEVIPDGKYFVIGDNRRNSNDSAHQWYNGNEEYLIDNIKASGRNIIWQKKR